MPPLEQWFRIGLALVLVPAALYALTFYALILRDVTVGRSKVGVSLRNFVVNATGPLIGVALYLLVVGGPVLGVLAAIDRITDT